MLAEGTAGQPSRRHGFLARLAALVGRSPSDPGTKRLADAVAAAPDAVLEPDEALRRLMPTVEDDLANAADRLYGEYVRLDLTGAPKGQVMARFREWQEVREAARTAADLRSSAWMREHLFAFAKAKGHDALTHTAAAVRGWSLAGRPQIHLCPECGSPTVFIEAVEDDSAVGLGAIDAGRACNRCEWDGRTMHRPLSRGSDAPFLD